MKTNPYSILIVLLTMLLAGCDHEMTVNDDTISLEIKDVQSTDVWLDMIPVNNDFYYTYTIVSADEMVKKYPTDVALIDSDFNARLAEYNEFYDLIDAVYRAYGRSTPSFEDWEFYNGAYEEIAYYDYQYAQLRPNTSYYLCFYCLNKQHKPIYSLIKKPFVTPELKLADLDFKLEFTQDSVFILPSNNNPYYVSLVPREILEIPDTLSHPDSMVTSVYATLYLEDEIEVLYKYGFMDALSDSCEQHYSLAELYAPFDKGDTIEVMLTGYDHQVTSRYYDASANSYYNNYICFEVIFDGADSQITRLPSVYGDPDDGSLPAPLRRGRTAVDSRSVHRRASGDLHSARQLLPYRLRKL